MSSSSLKNSKGTIALGKSFGKEVKWVEWLYSCNHARSGHKCRFTFLVRVNFSLHNFFTLAYSTRDLSLVLRAGLEVWQAKKNREMRHKIYVSSQNDILQPRLSIKRSTLLPTLLFPLLFVKHLPNGMHNNLFLSHLPQNRDCTLYFFERDAVCPEYPCIHTPCHSEDWLEDQEDSLADKAFYFRFWVCYNSPDSNKHKLSAYEWAKCESRFDRCRRIKEKRPEINAALERYREWWDQQRRDHRRRLLERLPEEARNKLKQRTKEIYDEVATAISRIETERREAGLEACTYEEWVISKKNLPKIERERLGIDDAMIQWCIKQIRDL